MLRRLEKSLQALFTVEVLAFNSLDFDAVGAPELDGIERGNNFREVDAALAEAAKLPFLFPALRIF